ncbi:hypothetical protein [Prosthecobacter vanneervenii]|uniref:Uncharacterized protein n=1 Tax=Prosthecobacter vanneervenii TaxID=48466 RepID=A0A7W7Y7Z4_9BACT|nr:hypothetical protein [Prosthecobacter vanneervenii]MBB5031244.1 hypothetical protein [Prosthecobacter vanneervenii]
MADINFKTQELANLYAYGNTPNRAGDLSYFRTNTDDATVSAIQSLDMRIANFQNVITDGAKQGSEDFPYDKDYLKREFMEEVFSILIKRSNYRASNAVYTSLFSSGPVTYSADGQDLLLNGTRTLLANGQTWDGNNFSNMTYDEMKAALKTGPNEGGTAVFDAYSAWIDAVFAEGNKLKNNPTDVVNIVSSIPERTLPTSSDPSIIYDRVVTVKTGTKDSLGNPVYNYFLVAKGAVISDVGKVIVPGTLNGQQVDATVAAIPSSSATSYYIQVDKNLDPVTPNGAGVQTTAKNLSPIMYLYYYMEARVRVLRGQLNMKEAVTSEIRDDLAKANSAYADLETQAGKTRAQSPDGKTTNPDLSYETTNMDFFEATNAKKGQVIYDNTGNDDLHNYSNWGASRSALKSYIDQKSTQSQDAMLDYQTTLNRFNQAYEVMSKIQEKMDGLIKGQLRNVG